MLKTITNLPYFKKLDHHQSSQSSHHPHCLSYKYANNFVYLYGPIKESKLIIKATLLYLNFLCVLLMIIMLDCRRLLFLIDRVYELDII